MSGQPTPSSVPVKKPWLLNKAFLVRIRGNYTVDPASGCWTWGGAKRNGYGAIFVDGRTISTHRFSYEIHHGPIPLGLTLDHLCRNRACINPDHLEPVTRGVNV